MEGISRKYLKYKRTGHFKRKVKAEIVKAKALPQLVSPSLLKELQSIVPIQQIPRTSEYNDNSIESELNVNEANEEVSNWSLELEDEVHNNFQLENNILRNIEFADDLRALAINSKMSHTTLKNLIGIINRRFPETIMEKDPRSFLGTPRTIQIEQISESGYYWHHGFRNCVHGVLTNHINSSTELSINVNIDGIPMFKSSKQEFIPILCNIFEIPTIKPMVIGIYCGRGKPDLKCFLNPFVSEMKDVLINGMIINNCRVTFKIRSFICDSPARAFVKGKL